MSNGNEDLEAFIQQNNLPLSLKNTLLSETTKLQQQKSGAITIHATPTVATFATNPNVATLSTIATNSSSIASPIAISTPVKTSRRKNSNPVRHLVQPLVSRDSPTNNSKSDPAERNQECFINEIHQSDRLYHDNCDVHGSHLPSGFQNRPDRIPNIRLEHLHSQKQNFTEPKWAKMRLHKAALKPKIVTLGSGTSVNGSAIAMSNPIKINKDNLGSAKSQMIFPQQVTMRMVNPVNGGSVPTTLVLAPIQKSNSGHLGGSVTTQILPKPSGSPIITQASTVKTQSQTQDIEEIETYSPQISKSLSGGETSLYDLREKAVAIKSCMSLTMNEVEKLVLGDMVVKVSNRKKPDQSLKYPCKFCIFFNHDTNGQVKLRSFGRKEEIKRHHMLHLRYERFQCQYCPYKVVRSDHLHRHMKNKHPEVAHPGPQSNRRRKRSEENISIDYTRSLGDTLESGEPSFSGYSAQFPGLSYNNGSNSTDDEFDQEFLKNVKPQNSSSNNNAINNSDIDPNAVAIAQLLSQNPQTLSPQALQLIVQSMKNGQLPLSNLLGAAGGVKTDPGMNSSFENGAKVSEETDDEDEEGNLVIAGEEADENPEGEIMEIELPDMIKNEVKSESGDDESENIEDIQTTPAAKMLKMGNGQGVPMS